jgi:molybdenum-dependent DNA-binding transcriptional regulator ModE
MDDFSAIFSDRLIECRHGGSGSGSAEITPFGAELVRQYRVMEARAIERLCEAALIHGEAFGALSKIREEVTKFARQSGGLTNAAPPLASISQTQPYQLTNV